MIEDLLRMSQSETSEAVEHCLRLLEPVKVCFTSFKIIIQPRLTYALATRASFPPLLAPQCAPARGVVYVTSVRQL